MKKAVKIGVYTAFVIYCLALVKVLLLDGRVQSESSVWFYFRYSNYIPFKTVINYIQMLAKQQINSETAIVNLVGNLIVLFPMGCFLPCMFPRFRKLRHTFFLCLCLVCAVELTQPLLRIGFFDIDDFILNLGGAVLGFLTVQIPPITRMLKKLYIYFE